MELAIIGAQTLTRNLKMGTGFRRLDNHILPFCLCISLNRLCDALILPYELDE